MSGIYDWYKWISEHSEDKRDFTPQPPTHPVPSYVAEADKAEHEAWQAYMRVVQEELESGDDHETDYVRLQQAKEKWERRAIQKNPITGDGNKKSACGLIKVEIDTETARFYALDRQSEQSESEGYLETVYKDGELLKETHLGEIRHNLSIELESFSG